MTVELRMPKMGFDMEEGTIGEWMKQEGDAVAVGDVIVEVVTDKATVEVESFEAGTLTHILVETGEVAPVGTVLALLDGEDEEPAAAEATETAARRPMEQPDGEQVRQLPAAYESKGQPIQMTPVARRMIQEKGFDPGEIRGRGRDGMIVKADVLAYEKRQQQAAEASRPRAAPPAPEAQPAPAHGRREDLSRMRQAIARRMSASNQDVPHFSVATSADMTRLLALRAQYNEEAGESQRLSINDFILRAAALTLRHFPRLNASYVWEQIEYHDAINVSMAVALDDGLITVVIAETDTKALSQIAGESKALVQRAREGKLRPKDLEDSTFTVSNLGAFKVESFRAIINPPEAAILAVGTVQEIPWNVEGKIKLQPRIQMTLSVDHRVSDGAEAARYLEQVTEYLEKPTRLI